MWKSAHLSLKQGELEHYQQRQPFDAEGQECLTPKSGLFSLLLLGKLLRVTVTEEFKALRRLALASLGRNVLHFQRVEAQLKRLVLICDFAASSSEFASRLVDRAAELRTRTMGNLAKELHKHLYGTPPDPEAQGSITEVFIRIGLRVDADPDYVAQQRKMLNDLVLERNTLVHQDLVDFDPNSEESCRRWIARLDEQNERIITLHQELQQLLDVHSEAAKHILVAPESKEFRQGL